GRVASAALAEREDGAERLDAVADACALADGPSPDRHGQPGPGPGAGSATAQSVAELAGEAVHEDQVDTLAVAPHDLAPASNDLKAGPGVGADGALVVGVHAEGDVV